MCNSSIKLDKYENHISLCYNIAINSNTDRSIVSLPKPETYMYFKNYKNKIVRPYIVYLDFECTLKPEADEQKHTRHVANSACYYFVCNFDSNLNKLETFKGDNCVQDLLFSLYHLAEECIREMRINQLMEMSDEDTRDFYNAERCHICKKIFLIKVIIKLETMIIEQVNI